MASRKDDGKTLLSLFHEMYKAAHVMHSRLVQMDIEAEGKHQSNKNRTLAALLGEFKQLNSMLNCLHHSIGHLFFSQCWEEIEVGQEFKNQLQELLDKLGVEMTAEVIDLNGPLPEHLDQEVKDALNKFKLSQEMSRKSHLH